MQQAQTGSHSFYLLTNYINEYFYCRQFIINDDVIQLDGGHSSVYNYSIGIEM